MTGPALTRLLLPVAALLAPGLAAAAETAERIDLTGHWVGFLSILIFVVAYGFVMVEEFTHLRKSKPVMLAAGIIWVLIAIVYVQNGMPHAAEAAVRHNILEYAELFLFLMAAMTYVNALDERLVFEALRSWLVSRGFGYRQLFWLTGFLAFFISPVADNLTTALLTVIPWCWWDVVRDVSPCGCTVLMRRRPVNLILRDSPLAVRPNGC